jgi:hypothetical protein
MHAVNRCHVERLRLWHFRRTQKAHSLTTCVCQTNHSTLINQVRIDRSPISPTLELAKRYIPS